MDKQLKIRLKPDVYALLAKAAKSSGRTISRQIELHLAIALFPPAGLTMADYVALRDADKDQGSVR